MTLILASVASILASFLIIGWRSVMERSVRWKLYELRDELRRYAIDHPEVRSRRAFHRIDNSISALCGSMKYVNLWTLLLIPLLARESRSAAEELRKDLSRQENAWLVPYYEKSVSLTARYLGWRHCMAMLVLLPTVFGFALIYVCTVKAARKAIGGGIDSFEKSGLVVPV